MFKQFFTLILSLFLSLQISNAQRSSTLRVLTFNIYHGATMKGDFDLDLIAGIIKNFNPDIVALQEVDFKTNRSKKYDIALELAIRTGLTPTFGSSMAFDGGDYGNAILTRRSIISSQKVTLPVTKGNEPRSALTVTTTIASGDTILFISTHLSHEDEQSRIEQVKRINELIKQSRYPAIVAGDLNAMPESESIQLMERVCSPSYKRSDPAPTYSSSKPQKKIDYVMSYPKNKWKLIERKTNCNSIASDHCAYFTILKLR